MTYAQMIELPPIPRERPTLILSPMTETIEEVRRALNNDVYLWRLQMAGCIVTKSGKLFITCNNEKE